MAQNEWLIHSERSVMGAKVFFSLERISSHCDTGHKATIKRRDTRAAGVVGYATH